MILETSWEVCNKMGGIYTVLSSRARAMTEAHKDEVVFVGPLLTGEGEAMPQDFLSAPPTKAVEQWFNKLDGSLEGMRLVVGRWNVPGKPSVVLVDFTPMWEQKGDIYFAMWQAYGLQSDKGYGDYDEASLFAVAASKVMMSLVQTLPKRTKHIAIFNEWQTAMGLLHAKLTVPTLRTLFITHATTVGRSIAGNGKELYAYMAHYDGDQMAAELNVEAKHAVEKLAAHRADCFATVSKLTARECAQLIGREPVVLPNGFEGDFVPKDKKYTTVRSKARKALASVAARLTGQPITERDCFVSLGGRYEYRNKGIDLFVEAVARLRQSYQGKRKVVAFLLVPGWVAEPRADLKYLLSNPSEENSGPMQHPTLTHWLHNHDTDAAMSHFRHLGLTSVDERVNIIFVPCYLHGADGIFNLSYYDLLAGMDLTVYPSYYEPWGYTPLESVAFGVPTVTTGFAGFGLWAQEELESNALFLQSGLPVRLIERTDHNAYEVIEQLSAHIVAIAALKPAEARAAREEAFRLAELAEWRHFYKYYLAAYKGIK
ncbi:MAG: glycogen/starch synthase [Porphyromonadaceae bacterium]|nr:glycogen/starch synthase [Porphyromonadaceae bacterium]